MTSREKEIAHQWCPFFKPGALCTLMSASQTESDPRCKLYRDEPEECRYLIHVVMRKGNRR